MKRRSVYDAKKRLETIMAYCCDTGDHKPFYDVLREYGVERGTEEYANAVAALLEFCRKRQSR